MTDRYGRQIAVFGACLYLCVLFVCKPLICQAQEDRHNEYLLKSAFIERFTRFVEWPPSFEEGGENQTFVMGALCTPEFCQVLEAAFAGHRIKNLPVIFRRIKSAQDGGRMQPGVHRQDR